MVKTMAIKRIISAVAVLLCVGTSYAAGPAPFVNGDFSNTTLSGNVIADPTFDNAGAWSSTPASWTVAGGVAVYTAPTNANLTTTGNPLTAGQAYYVTCEKVDDSMAGGVVEMSSRTWHTTGRIDTAGVTSYEFYTVAIGQDVPDVTIRGKNASGGTFTVDNHYAYPISLDDWTVEGDRTTTEYLRINGSVNRLRFVSGSTPIGVWQAVSNGTYTINLDTQVLNSGSADITDGGSNTVVVASSGTTTFQLTIATEKLYIMTTSGAADFELNSIAHVSGGDYANLLLHVY